MSAQKPGALLRVDPATVTAEQLAAAAEVLRSGGLVAFPTETVYGLGANALDPGAVARIFAAKRRPPDNPLIVHVASTEDLEGLVGAVTPLARALARRWWPGPLTLVLEAAPPIPAVTTGGHPTVAIRVPAHPVALALIEAAGVPLAAPSANRSGRPSPTTAAHVLADLADDVDLVIDGGPCTVGVESTVVDARGDRPVVLREGSISREDLLVPSAELVRRGPPDAAAPGLRYRHYAPRCAVEVAPPGQAVARAQELARNGRQIGLITAEGGDRTAVSRGPEIPGVTVLAVFRDAQELAQQLYGGLRAAEDAGVDVVVVESVEPVGVGRAVMDRLRRAAQG